MTVYEILDQAWIEAGEPSDMDAGFSSGSFDPASVNGGARMLRYMNSALVRIANWKFRDGTLLRLRSLLGRKFFYTRDAAGAPYDVVSGSDLLLTLQTGLTDYLANAYAGCVVEVTTGDATGDRRLILSNFASGGIGHLITRLNEPLSATMAPGDQAIIYTDFVEIRNTENGAFGEYRLDLDPQTQLLDVVKVRDVIQNIDLSPTLREDAFTPNRVQPGIPTLYRAMGDRIYFDVPVNEARSYEVLYIRQPAKVAIGTDVPDIPEQYHEALGLWVAHNLQRVYQDYDKAYATKRELEDIMAMTRAQGASDMDMEQGGLTVWG